MVVSDPMGHLLGVLLGRRGDRHAGLCAPVRRVARAAEGRAVHADDVLAARRAGDAVGEQLPRHLPRARAAEPAALRARRDAPRQPEGDRSGDEVLRARRAVERLPALRPVDDVRRHRLARSRRGLQGDRHRRDQQVGADLRPGLHRRRARLQARCGAVPHVGARRLRRRADRDHAADRRRAGVRGVRDHDPAAGRRHARARGRLAADAGAAVDRLDHARHAGGDRADQPEAHARLFDDRADGLHDARAWSRGSSAATPCRPPTPTARRCSTS